MSKTMLKTSLGAIALFATVSSADAEMRIAASYGAWSAVAVLLSI